MRAGRALPGAGAVTGQIILGWGIFNLVEGLVNHRLLGIHHVRDMPMHVPMYDWLFLGIGSVGLTALSWLMFAAAAGAWRLSEPLSRALNRPIASAGPLSQPRCDRT